MNLDEYWTNLVEAGIATDAELKLVTAIDGYNEQTLDNVVYARTGYENWKQYADCEIRDDDSFRKWEVEQ